MFAEKDSRRRTAKRPKLHSKNRYSLAIQVRLQNRQKRQTILGTGSIQIKGEDAVHVLLTNILEEERRMHGEEKAASDDA